MTEQAQKSNQQIIVIGLVVIAALLAAIVGVMIYQQSKTNAIPAPTAAATSTTTEDQAAAAAASNPMMTKTDGEFDAKTATKVPAGTEPEAFVTEYYKACDDGKWEVAFKMLPAAKQAGNSAKALQEQVEGYGIKSAKVTDAKVEGDKASVTAEQVTGSYGTFVNTWTFVKQGGVWLVESKAVTGMK